MKEINEGLNEYKEEAEEIVLKKCAQCDERGMYRYAPYDFEKNWQEDDRWRCFAHGKQYHGDVEWDYFGYT